MAQYDAGTVDFTRVTQIQQNLVLQQDTLAQAQGEIALGLITVYKAMGGGWQIRQTGCSVTALQLQDAPSRMAGQNPAPASTLPQALPVGGSGRALLLGPSVEP